MARRFLVKYGYKRHDACWAAEYATYKNFDHFGEALRWIMETKAEGKIRGFRVIRFEAQGIADAKPVEPVKNRGPIVVVPPFERRSKSVGNGCGRYEEGSTDASIVGCRYY